MKKFLAFLFAVVATGYAFAGHQTGWGLFNASEELSIVSLNEKSNFIISVDHNINHGKSDPILLICGNRNVKIYQGTRQICNKSIGEVASIKILAEDFHNGSMGTIYYLDDKN